MARKVGITDEALLEAAAELADATGLAGVTLAALAQRLGIRSPSLYAHVSSLEGLRRRLALHGAARMAASLRHQAAGHAGTEALWRLSHGYRAFARTHPGLYDAVQRAVRPGEDDELYRALAGVALPLVEVLSEMGVTSADVVHLARAFRSALHGFVALERLGGFGMPESVDDSFGQLVGLLVRGVCAAADGSPSGPSH